MRLAPYVLSAILFLPLLPAQEEPEAEQPAPALRERPAPEGESVAIPAGTRFPLVLINSVSTKNAAPGDRVYLESVYPVVVDGKILVPPGTYVSGSITSSKRPGRVKGKGELYVRFEQMILPNGVIRDLTGRVGSLDGRSPERFDHEEGKIQSEGGVAEDIQTVGQTTAAGASIGTIAGAAGGNTLGGLGYGSLAGAAAGVIGVLASRGPDAILERGTQVDMVLEYTLYFTPEELTFDNPLARPNSNLGNGPDPNRNRSTGNNRRFPL